MTTSQRTNSNDQAPNYKQITMTKHEITNNDQSLMTEIPNEGWFKFRI